MLQRPGNMPRQTTILPPAIAHAAKRTAGRTAADATPLHIRGHHITVDESLERYVRDRASRKLAKYAHSEQRVTVRFEDPHAGDVACRIKIVIPAAPSIVVEDRAGQVRDAFDLAIDNAARALAHSLQKHGRSSGKPPRGRREVAAIDAAERKEALDAEAASADAIRRPKNHLARAPRATAALEDTNGRPSRKSTRASSNHVKQATPLQQRQLSAMNAPGERAQRGAVSARRGKR
jgi:ribosome-associated translation inhibitor RaiA